MDEIDLTVPKSEYKVPVVNTRDGVDYMGPDVKINAHSAADAVKRVEAAGYKANRHQSVTKVETPWKGLRGR